MPRDSATRHYPHWTRRDQLNANNREHRNNETLRRGRRKSDGLIVQIIEILIPFSRSSDSHFDRVERTIFKSACLRGRNPETMRVAKTKSKLGLRLYTWFCMRTLPGYVFAFPSSFFVSRDRYVLGIYQYFKYIHFFLPTILNLLLTLVVIHH